jgi:hypothetical protein
LLEIPFGRSVKLDGFHLHVGACDAARLYVTDASDNIIDTIWTSGTANDWIWVPCHKIISHDPQVALAGGTSLYIKLNAEHSVPAGQEAVGYVQGKWDPEPADSKRFSVFARLTKAGAGDEVLAMLSVASGEDVVIEHAAVSKGEAGVTRAYVCNDTAVAAGATNEMIVDTVGDPQYGQMGYQVGRIESGPAAREIFLFGTGGAVGNEIMGYIDGYYLNQ